MKNITAKEYREQHQGQEAEMDTYLGPAIVTGINERYEAYCPKENGGYGRTYHIHAGTELRIRG